MRITTTQLIAAFCWAAPAATTAIGHIYTFDPKSEPRPNTSSRSLSPIEARLVAAQRIGVEDYHASDLVKPEVITAINDYGVRTALFTSERRMRRAIILVEEDGDPEAFMPMLKSHTGFQVTPAPAASASRDLLVDLAKQSNPRQYMTLSDNDVLRMLQDNRKTSSKGDLFYLAKSMTDFEAQFTKLVSAQTWSITALIVPTRDSKEGEEAKWGTYEMPATQSPLKKRQQEQEAPLAETEEFQPVESFTSPISTLQDSEPLRGILPACFLSLSSCETETRNCTGKGTCTKQFHDPDSGSNGVDCYACVCTPTKSEDGRKTTYWGGPACQKKDISIEFWLIALFTVGLVFLVTFAVGTIWEMGSEELPSVIGAGVSGTGARK